VAYRFKGLPRLNNKEIIQLFRDGFYKVDLEKGIVIGKSGKPLKPKMGGRTKQYLKIRMYHEGRVRELPLAHAVWLAGSMRDIPEGFEIHHKDTNLEHNWWTNLFCLFELDHRKLHNGHKLLDEPEEETPF
jgi:hypothetical protein